MLQPNVQLPQYDEYLDKYEDENPNVAEKRSWDNFQGSWGKRAADWTSFRGKPVSQTFYFIYYINFRQAA